MTDDEYTQELDRETVARERSKRSWPDPAKVRRVRIADGDYPRAMAHAANDDREREGATE